MTCVVRWFALALGALLLGVVLGIAAGLVRRRPTPEVTSYLAPPAADGPSAIGPHRAVLRATG
jgi:hypothetical protein